jgi:hypothetical protein
MEQVLKSLGAEVTDVDYARDRIDNTSRIFVEIRLPRSELEEPMVKVLEDLPSVRKLRVRRADI